jgi:hypothetical protein
MSNGPAAFYFSELLIDVNLVLSLVPRPLMTAMMASEMPAAIRPYSMAVAPDSSARNLRIVLMRQPWPPRNERTINSAAHTPRQLVRPGSIQATVIFKLGH